MTFSVKESVRLTYAYSRFFKFPLQPAEIHRWLISSKPVSFVKIKKFIKPITPKEKKYRSRLEKISQTKKNKLRSFINFSKLFPNLKMIAITGSVAVNNASRNDDIDLMLVFSSDTLWLTRPIFLFFSHIFFPLRRPMDSQSPDSLCFNLWLDTSALSIPKNRRNLYTAHEILQIVPVFNREKTYEKLIKSNSWSSKFLANAYHLTVSSFTQTSRSSFSSNLLVKALNYIFFLSQFYYMKSKMTREHITSHSAYFHPRDFASEVDKAILN